MATKNEIEELKHSWLSDPCWDIEETEGFEEHKAELLAFRKQHEAECEAKAADWKMKRAMLVADETGVTGSILQALSTFTEIEHQINNAPDGDATKAEITMTELAQAQARAILLLAAQVKRVADVLENMDGRGSLEEAARIWGS